MKYYWIKYIGDKLYEAVIDNHPFEFIANLNKLPTAVWQNNTFSYNNEMIYYTLDRWKRIEVEEYNLYRELNDNN